MNQSIETVIRINQSIGKGEIEIEFSNNGNLDVIIETLEDCVKYKASSVLALLPIWNDLASDRGVKLTYKVLGSKFNIYTWLAKIAIKLNFYNFRKDLDYFKFLGVTYYE